MKTLILIIMMLVAVSGVLAQDDPCMALGGRLNQQSGECNLQTGVTVDIDYPMLDDEPAFVVQAIGDFVQALQAGFIQNYNDQPLSDLVSFPWEMVVDYEAFQYSDTIQSYNFTIYEYTGGAHGNTAFRTFNFNLNEEREITLDDLLDDAGLETVEPIARQQLQDRLGEMLDADWLEEGTAPNPQNYQHFVLTPEAIVFYFPPYQVAPYAAGTQSVAVPLSDLQHVLAAPFLSVG